MTFPVVTDLADDGVPVSLSCRVLGFSRQAYYQWLADPVSDREWSDAHAANAVLDAHADDPEFGYRFLADELRGKGLEVSDHQVLKACRLVRVRCCHSIRRGSGKRPGPPAHDDLVKREFRAEAANRLWLTDISEHWAGDSKLYLCAVKDGRFQGASATPSRGGSRDGFVGPTLYRLHDAALGCFGARDSSAIPREHGSGCGVGQACRHGHSHGRSWWDRAGKRSGSAPESISQVSASHA